MSKSVNSMLMWISFTLNFGTGVITAEKNTESLTKPIFCVVIFLRAGEYRVT